MGSRKERGKRGKVKEGKRRGKKVGIGLGRMNDVQGKEGEGKEEEEKGGEGRNWRGKRERRKVNGGCIENAIVW